jgi:hypothetical protein
VKESYKVILPDLLHQNAASLCALRHQEIYQPKNRLGSCMIDCDSEQYTFTNLWIPFSEDSCLS